MPRVSARQFVRTGLLTVVIVMLTGGGAVVLAAVRSPRSSGGVPIGATAARQLSISCPAPALGGRLPAVVYLPGGYADDGPRLPVIYFLHGLPATPQTYTQNGFVAAALAAAHLQAIVVAPQGTRGSGTLADREYLDWSPTENWPRAISHDLTQCVDRRFHTVPARRGRVLVGLSAGGYGAFNVGLRNLGSFAAVESWSGYFAATDPSGYHLMRFASADARQAATVPAGRSLARQLAHTPALIAFYVGRDDSRFAQDNRSFDATLSRSGIPHVYRSYAGAHSMSLWHAQAPGWLGMALSYLASGRATAPARAG